MIEQFKAAKAVSVPIVCISTPDQLGVVDTLSNLEEAEAVVRWDLVRGAVPLNDAGAEQLAMLGLPQDTNELMMKTQRPSQFLTLIAKAKDCTFLLLNAHRVLEDAATVQAVCNARDSFGKQGSMLAMLAPDWSRIPSEIGTDAYVIDDPLPQEEDIGPIIDKVSADVGVTINDKQREQASFSLAGLSRFACVQAGSLMYALNDSEFNNRSLQEFKEQRIRETPGLDVYKGTETFKDIGGAENAIKFITDVMNGPEKPNAIVFIDEIEKYISDQETDTSGVNQDAKGTLLQEMENKRALGIICIGPPGSGKSLYAKAIGNTFEIPTIMMDFGGVKGSLVGQSEQQLRTAFKVIDAVARGRALYIATCNKIATLPPEVKRRFNLCTFYFELPSATERKAIWAIQKSKFGITNDPTFDDNQWTGAEIAAACRNAYIRGITLDEAAKSIVPYHKSNRAALDALRDQANNTFISASYEGTFDKDRTSTSPDDAAVRRMKLGAATGS